MKIRAPKKISTTVPKPRASGLGLFVKPSAPPRVSVKRTYTKEAARSDPSEFTSFGFGNTGVPRGGWGK
jgi:hypothetical protein